MDPARKPILEPIVQHIVVSFVVQSQSELNHDNVCMCMDLLLLRI